MRKTCLAFILAATTVSVPAAAANWNGICQPDIEKYCTGIPPGQGRILACLQGNRDRITPACQKAGKWWRNQVQTYAKACLADQLRVCKGVKAGWGAIHRCMEKNTAKLSAKCRDLRAANKDKLANLGSDCKADLKAHCKRVKSGLGRKLQCLERKQAKLSPACAKHFR